MLSVEPNKLTMRGNYTVGSSPCANAGSANGPVAGNTNDRRQIVGCGKTREEHVNLLDYTAESPADNLAIDEALSKLETEDPRKAEVVMLRYFAGLTGDETAQALGLSPRTVDSEWRFAKAWLHRRLSGE